MTNLRPTNYGFAKGSALSSAPGGGRLRALEVISRRRGHYARDCPRIPLLMRRPGARAWRSARRLPDRLRTSVRRRTGGEPLADHERLLEPPLQVADVRAIDLVQLAGTRSGL